MKKTKEECLLRNGIMSYDLGKNEARIMQAMDDFAADSAQIKLPTPSDLEAMAMKKFPVKLIRHSGIHPDIDGNEPNRAIFLSGLQAAVKMMGGQE